ncbi:MAG: MFS transporter [Caldilineaceae bacterium SB0675_bin_29]|uniref:MFS transporter n=1 Tax=Caldilineaceae bacterium SB0675_bin_29 TaxID=2605266 RepID=A0A6B1FVY0_9CHLR|nr:MFS transporter [Caldilineaceae bacterium SB0675_bin_29]
MNGSDGRDGGYRGRAAALVCVGLAMFLAALAQTVVASIVPLIVADLGGFDRYTWPSSSYLVAATVAYPIVGRLSDIYGRRAFLIAGIAIFIAGSALVGFSGSMNQVIGFRALQGLGGGAVMTCCYVSVADLFPPEDRGKFHGILGAVYALATVVGPVMGVLIAEWLSWQYTFLFIALAGLPVLLLTARRFPGPRSLPRQWELDYAGMATLAVAVTAVALASAEVSHAWYAPQAVGLLAFGLATAALFVAIESRFRSPIMPLGIYRNRAVAVAVVVTLLTSAALHAFVLFLPLYFQLALGVSATQAGTMLMPMLLGIVLGAIVAGQLLSRTGGHYRVQALAGTALMAGGMYLFSILGDGGGVAQSMPVLFSQLYLIIAALGFGAVVATLSVAVQNGVAFRHVGSATAALQFSRSLGGMVGLAATGVVMLQSFRTGVETLVPDNVRSILPEGLFSSVKEDPRALVDPAAAQVLKEVVAGPGSGNLPAADSLLHSLNLALTGALSNVFTVLWVAVALSLPVALLLRVRAGSNGSSPRGP